MPLPPRASVTLREQIAATHFHFAVAVKPYGTRHPSDELVLALRATRLFDEVGYADELASPARLVARVEGLSRGAAVIPFWTALSLGLVPTTAEEVYGVAFSLAPAGEPEQRLAFDARWTGDVVLGWVCLLRNLSVDRDADDPRRHPRYAEHVAAGIAARGDEVLALARQGSRR